MEEIAAILKRKDAISASRMMRRLLFPENAK